MEEFDKEKIFGIGPKGALISVVLLIFFLILDQVTGLPPITRDPGFIRVPALLLILCGLALHAWSFFTLRSWWKENQLCTRGPFRFFRHPMYAAWITFICPGVAIFFNAWTLLLWLLLLHPIWHWLVTWEERWMLELFGEPYRDFSAKTGRFLPRLRK